MNEQCVSKVTNKSNIIYSAHIFHNKDLDLLTCGREKCYDRATVCTVSGVSAL